MNALLVKPLFPLFLEEDLPPHLIIPRYFMAKHLRSVHPSIWSNSRPNSSTCSPSLVHACTVLKQLYTVDSNFASLCRSTKDIVKMLRPDDVTASIVRKYPNFPWNKIWELSFSKVLDNKLMDFQWRLAHHILYTGKRIKDWGMGDGICPVDGCRCVETLDHIFWECPKVKPVLEWTEKIFKNLVGRNVAFRRHLFMYGFPGINCSKQVFNRIWFVFCVTKFSLWKSRCLLVFESQVQSDQELLSIIIKAVKNRIEADRHRFSDGKFSKSWTMGRSFVKRVNGQLVYYL